MIDERRAAALARAYLAAKLAVLRSEYAAEVVAPSIQIQTLSESDFLRELAWVILSAGMAERVVRLEVRRSKRSLFELELGRRDFCPPRDLRAVGTTAFWSQGKNWRGSSCCCCEPSGRRSVRRFERKSSCESTIQELQRFSYIDACDYGIPPGEEHRCFDC